MRELENNKYFIWYRDLCNSRQKLNRTKSECYYEEHHIMPRSLGGTDDRENLVLLTPREHYIAHLLLTKFTYGKSKVKMNHALWRMACCNGIIINSRLYQTLKESISQELSERNSSIRSHTFSGWYITPFGKFISSRQASESIKNKLSYKLIQAYCKRNNTKLTNRSNIKTKYFQEEDIGKSFKELGFSFQEIQ